MKKKKKNQKLKIWTEKEKWLFYLGKGKKINEYINKIMMI